MSGRWLPDETTHCEVSPEQYEFTFPPDSFWFEGHFPERPVLPGVALLTAVCEHITRVLAERGDRRQVAGVRNIRFRKIVRPLVWLTCRLQLPAPDSSEARFSMQSGEERICSGVVLLRSAQDGSPP